MALDQYFEDAVAHNDSDLEDIFCVSRKSDPDEVCVSADNSSGNFDCNICLDYVQDPVVTLCGHLYCWPCIYKWLHLQSISTEDEDQRHKQCPVCKAKISHSTLVPLYGRGQTTNQDHGKVIPRRPVGPVYGFDIPRSRHGTGNLHLSQQFHLNYSSGTQVYYPQQSGYHPPSPMLSTVGMISTMIDPMIGVLGEMVCSRLFGISMSSMYTCPNSYSFMGGGGPRARRQMMQADKSLSRICFFLFCCIILCLLLF